MCLRKLQTRVPGFETNWWSVMFVVSGQELIQRMELVYISFPFSGITKYVVQLWAGKISDCRLFVQQSQWLRFIVENRPHHAENVRDLNDFSDIRNGIFSANHIHGPFDQRRVVIFKVCCIYSQVTFV